MSVVIVELVKNEKWESWGKSYNFDKVCPKAKLEGGAYSCIVLPNQNPLEFMLIFILKEIWRVEHEYTINYNLLSLIRALASSPPVKSVTTTLAWSN